MMERFRAAAAEARHNTALAATALLLLAAAPAFAAQPTYTLTNLGSFGGPTIGYALNNRGQVVGEAQTKDGNEYPFLSDGTTTRLLTGPLGSQGQGAGINDSGVGVGVLNFDADNQFGIIYNTNTNAIVASARNTTPKGINNSGQVTGFWLDSEFQSATFGGTFLFDGTTMHDLSAVLSQHFSSLPGFGAFTGSTGAAINNHGIVAGVQTWTLQGTLHYGGFVIDGTTVKDIGSLGGGDATPQAINDQGQVVGYSTLSSGASHAFLYDGAAIHDLGTLPGQNFSEAYAINDQGQVVGTSSGPSSVGAFFYDGTTMHDLNGLVDASDPLKGQVSLRDARAINDDGQIVANGCLIAPGGACYAFLLTPKGVAAP